MTRLILTHAWQMIAADWGKTIRIAALPWGAMLLVAGAIDKASQSVENPGAMIVLSFPLGIAMTLCYLWVLVGWHRYVLLGEGPGRLGPGWNGDKMLSYFGYVVLISLISLVPLSVLLLIGSSSLEGAGLGQEIYALVIFLPIYYLSTRLSLVLPSVAVAGPVGIAASWSKTAALSSTIWKISAALVALELALFVLATGVGPSSLMADAILLVGYGFIGLYGASILTTLYGYLVEGRALSS